MKVLDLYCGAGLVARGIMRSGPDVSVFGVDNKPQPRYPHWFHQGDALAVMRRLLVGDEVSFRQGVRERLIKLGSFSFIWASPPCQHDTALKHAPNAKQHRQFIPPTRRALQDTGLPYAIENVPGAPLLDPVTLCGTHFNLGTYARPRGQRIGQTFDLQRHRLIETNWQLSQPRYSAMKQCVHNNPVIGIYGDHVRCRSAAAGGRVSRDFVGLDKKRLALTAMGMEPDRDDALTMRELSQGIPPDYAKYVFKAWRAA